MRQDPIRLYWWNRPDLVNLGDELNAYIVAHVSGREVVHASLEDADMLGIGSVLNFPQTNLHQRKSPYLVWGSGSLNNAERNRKELFHCSALRGPMTLSLMGPHHGPVPFGDPGILTSTLWPVRGPKRHRWGLVPHYNHINDDWVKRALAQNPDTVLIDVRDPDVQKSCELIGSCEYIASTSLHGLIIADSYGVPNVWLTTGGANGTWKYWDYFTGVGRYSTQAVPTSQTADLSKLESKLGNQRYLRMMPTYMKRLADAFPI